MRLLAETALRSGALVLVGLAACALLTDKLDAKGMKVGVLISGGNVDLAWAAARLKAR